MIRPAVLVLCGILCAVGTVGAQGTRAVGDTRVFASLPDDGNQGHPMGIAVDGDSVIVATGMWAGSNFSGSNPPANSAATYTFSLSAPGAPPITRTITQHGAELMGMALSTTDAYVAAWGDVIRVNRSTGEQESYATLPPLQPCGLNPSWSWSCASPNPNCSPKNVDSRTMGADTVFDAAGNLYVTDQIEGTIWRIPPNGPGQTARIWFQDRRIVGEGIGGAGGARIGPDGQTLYFTVDDKSAVFRLPIKDCPTSDDLQVFYSYESSLMSSSPAPFPRCSATPAALCPYPEGLAFGETGNKLYVALAAENAISVLELKRDQSGVTEAARYPLLASDPTAVFLYNTPYGVALDGGGSLLVTDDSFLFDQPSQYRILDVFVGDAGMPLDVPVVP